MIRGMLVSDVGYPSLNRLNRLSDPTEAAASLPNHLVQFTRIHKMVNLVVHVDKQLSLFRLK